jgi:hypothetical protein
MSQGPPFRSRHRGFGACASNLAAMFSGCCNLPRPTRNNRAAKGTLNEQQAATPISEAIRNAFGRNIANPTMASQHQTGAQRPPCDRDVVQAARAADGHFAGFLRETGGGQRVGHGTRGGRGPLFSRKRRRRLRSPSLPRRRGCQNGELPGNAWPQRRRAAPPSPRSWRRSTKTTPVATASGRRSAIR